MSAFANLKNKKSHRGFTIVELLIVIVVIAILAAISIVAYNGIQSRANDSAVKSDLASASKALELYYVDNSAYPTNLSQLRAMKTAGNYILKVTTSAYTIPANNFIFCYGNTSDEYALAARSKSNNAWYISNTVKQPTAYPGTWTGVLATTCTSPLGMSSNAVWGYTASTWDSTFLTF